MAAKLSCERKPFAACWCQFREECVLAALGLDILRTGFCGLCVTLCAHDLSGMGDNHGKRDLIFIYNQSHNDKIKTMERKIDIRSGMA